MQATKLRRMIIVGIGVVAILAIGAAAWWLQAPSAADREVVFVIPPGTAARGASGAATPALPQTINLTLNRQDVLVIRNDDSQAVQIGPFKIEPGQRFVQQYYNRGTYELMCTIHVAQRMQVIVR